jgi:iron complex transport system substrate-binding protein
MRICSLLPSATEVIFALGLGESLVAVSHECDFPAAAAKLPKITRSTIPHGLSSGEIDSVVTAALTDTGSLYTLDVDLLKRLAPDVIVTQQLCDVCAVATDQLQDALDSGWALGRRERGAEVVAGLRRRIEAVAAATRAVTHRPRVFCMEWADPPYCGGHWMKDLVEIAGGDDALAIRNKPSRRVEWQSVRETDPEIVVLTCCGFDLDRCTEEARLIAERGDIRDVTALRAGAVFATDSAAYFARPGPRIVDSLEILAAIIHPELGTAAPPARAFRHVDLAKVRAPA